MSERIKIGDIVRARWDGKGRGELAVVTGDGRSAGVANGHLDLNNTHIIQRKYCTRVWSRAIPIMAVKALKNHSF